MTTNPQRRWHPSRLSRVDQAIRNGHGYTEIARQQQTTVRALKAALWRYGGRQMRQMPHLYNIRQVITLLGLPSDHAIKVWIRAGWLDATKSGSARTCDWRISRVALLQFLANRATWMAWSVEQIADPSYRQIARNLRMGQPCWLSVGEVAARYHVTRRAVLVWLSEQQLVPSVLYARRLWVWSADLDGFVPPCLREVTL